MLNKDCRHAVHHVCFLHCRNSKQNVTQMHMVRIQFGLKLQEKLSMGPNGQALCSMHALRVSAWVSGFKPPLMTQTLHFDFKWEVSAKSIRGSINNSWRVWFLNSKWAEEIQHNQVLNGGLILSYTVTEKLSEWWTDTCHLLHQTWQHVFEMPVSRSMREHHFILNGMTNYHQDAVTNERHHICKIWRCCH